jgi:hypothetical protein
VARRAPLASQAGRPASARYACEAVQSPVRPASSVSVGGLLSTRSVEGTYGLKVEVWLWAIVCPLVGLPCMEKNITMMSLLRKVGPANLVKNIPNCRALDLSLASVCPRGFAFLRPPLDPVQARVFRTGGGGVEHRF